MTQSMNRTSVPDTPLKPSYMVAAPEPRWVECRPTHSMKPPAAGNAQETGLSNPTNAETICVPIRLTGMLAGTVIGGLVAPAARLYE